MSARHRLLLPITIVVLGLTACASTPAAAPAPVAAPASISPSSASAPVAPSASAPASAEAKTEAKTEAETEAEAGATAKVTPKAKPTARTRPAQRTAPCPSAKALEKLADLPEGWRFVPSSVECWHDWATADPEGPNDGDGLYLFRYRAGTGWKYHSQGSAYDCAALGLREPAPFCEYR